MEISVKNLKKAYKSRTIINDVSFSVKSGEILGILGADGSGKTTMLRLLTSFLSADSGEICYNGIPIYKNREKIKRSIGYLAESNPLYEMMTVLEFITYIALLYKVPSYIMPARIMDVLRICKLDNDKHTKIKGLSKGSKRRVGIAQAIINDPEVMLLDEPTSGLDPNQSEDIRSLIKQIARGRTVIISSHLLKDVESTCDHIIIMHKGTIVADGTAAQLQNKRENGKIVKVKFATATLQQSLEAIKLLPEVDNAYIEDDFIIVHGSHSAKIEQALFKLCEAKGWYIKTISAVELSLDEIFRSLTQN